MGRGGRGGHLPVGLHQGHLGQEGEVHHLKASSPQGLGHGLFLGGKGKLEPDLQHSLASA